MFRMPKKEYKKPPNSKWRGERKKGPTGQSGPGKNAQHGSGGQHSQKTKGPKGTTKGNKQSGFFW